MPKRTATSFTPRIGAGPIVAGATARPDRFRPRLVGRRTLTTGGR